MSDLSKNTHLFPRLIANRCGLRMEWNSTGSIRRVHCHDAMVNLFPPNALEAGPSQLLLRLFDPQLKDYLPLLGPASFVCWRPETMGAVGEARWYDLLIRIRLRVAEHAPAWFWHVDIENRGSRAVACDLMFAQDLGLAHESAVRMNEYYVSQYIDHLPLQHEQHGCCIASRQNQSMGGQYPAALIGSLGRAVSYATDALSVFGRGHRNHQVADCFSGGLPGKKRQHEHSLVALQEEKFSLDAGDRITRGFFVGVMPDHPEVLSERDLAHFAQVISLPEAICPAWPEEEIPQHRAFGLFSIARDLPVDDLNECAIVHYFGEVREQEEREDGQLLSWFTPDHQHVVLRAKEERVLRPHGMILRSGSGWAPDESSMTSTAWMNGVFHSMVTQGHVSINRFLSTCRSYLGLFRTHGMRIMMEIEGAWFLLGAPSAFAMSERECRWIYHTRSGDLLIRSAADAQCSRLSLDIEVRSGLPRRFLLIHHVALNGDDGLITGPVLYEKMDKEIRVKAALDSDVGRRFPDGCFAITTEDPELWQCVGGDEVLWEDKRSRGEPYLCLKTKITNSVRIGIEGRLLPPSTAIQELPEPKIRWGIDTDHPSFEMVSAWNHFIPWLVQNALVHYRSPRGLEQYSGGGWGTRDVCQGPMELMLAFGRFAEARDLLLRVYRQQNPDGDWPQWFMFFDRERNIRPEDSHGDIVFWPVWALSQYLCATRDASILEESLPYFSRSAEGVVVPIREHVEHALRLMRSRVIPGTMLASYGHGDWNDSMQPSQEEMRENLCSAWTVTLHEQTVRCWADACEALGIVSDLSTLREEITRIRSDFQHHMVVDGVLTGLMQFPSHGSPRAFLHPRDEDTGIRYSLLPMIHAIINELFSREQAAEHLLIIREHLMGPDGARLFDRPLSYHGGISQRFLRAETASYFGREIGLMYTHAHIRYAEALARFGAAKELWQALQQINPIGLRELVPSSSLRQLNCYYSSSDADFADRYEAAEQYNKLHSGDVSLEGGWRVYSSGSGIAVRVMVQCFLGLRIGIDEVVIDPVIDPSLSGLVVECRLDAYHWQVIYHIGPEGTGPQSVKLNDVELTGTRLIHPYRCGGLRFSIQEWRIFASGGMDRLVIVLG
ncbi:MAG: hypothetical protein RI957_177 [Verrucomicrobiota bacterium]